MQTPREPIWRRYLRLVRPDPVRDVADELEFHVASVAAGYEAQGVPPDEARRRALREVGDLDAARRECVAIDRALARRERHTAWRAVLGQDLGYAVRMLRRAPAFSAVALLILALAIGANTAIFSVVHGVLLRGLPFPDPERLVRVWETTPSGGTENVVSPGNVSDWRARATSFSDLGAYFFPFTATHTGMGEPVRIRVQSVMPVVFAILGTPPLTGRGLVAADADESGDLVVLSHAFWQSRFGGAGDAVGRTIVLDDRPHTIVGVMPRDFSLAPHRADAWRPLTTASVNWTERRAHNFYVIGRLRANASAAQAQAELSALAGAIAVEHPEHMTGYGVRLLPWHRDLVADVRPMLLVLFGGAVLVLLVACANLANLLLARALTREREMAVRGALGAGRGRLTAQLLTENLVLAAAGALLGLGVAALLVRALPALAAGEVPLLDRVRLEPAVLLFTVVLTVGCTVLFGLVPALRLARADLQTTLRAGSDRSGGVRHGRLRAALLVGEVALSLLLLVGAGLLLRSARRLAGADYGFRSDHLLAVTLDLPRSRYATMAQRDAFYDAVRTRAAALPQVTAAVGTSEPPASGFNMTFSFAIEGRPAATPRGREEPQPLRAVTPEYFRALGVPVLRGRAIDARDAARAPAVVVINEALARLHWPDQDPVGARISFAGAEGPWAEIVGVVGSTRIAAADREPDPAIYVAYAQRRWEWMSWQTILLRFDARARVGDVASAVRGLLRELDPNLAPERVATVDELYGESQARRRFVTTLLGGFAALGLVLGAVGMYGVIAYAVAQRGREIGIRMALGATAGRIVTGVLRQAVLLAGGGVAIGTLAALLLAPLLRGLLYQVEPADPATFGVTAGGLVLTALLAAWVPARRATRVDPLRAVRDS